MEYNQLTIKPLEEGVLQVQVQMPTKDLEPLFAENEKKVMAKASIKGFRKGKAPLSMVRKIYGGEIQYEVWNQLLKDLSQLLHEKDHIHIGEILKFEGIENYQKIDPLTITVEMVIYPRIREKGNADGFTYTVSSEENTAEAITKEWKVLENHFTEYQDLTPSDKIALKDFIKCKYSFTSGEKNQSFEKFLPIQEDHPEYFMSQFLQGKEATGAYDFECTIPEDYFIETWQKENVQVHLEIIEGQRPKIPSREEIAQKLSLSVEAIEKTIASKIQNQQEEKAKMDIVKQFLDFVRKTSVFQIHPKYLEEQRQHEMNQILQEMYYAGADMDAYLESQELSKDNLEEGLNKKARKRLEDYLLTNAFMQDWNISVTEEELKTYIQTLLTFELLNQENIQAYYTQNEGARQNLLHHLESLKFAQYIESNYKKG